MVSTSFTFILINNLRGEIKGQILEDWGDPESTFNLPCTYYLCKDGDSGAEIGEILKVHITYPVLACVAVTQ